MRILVKSLLITCVVVGFIVVSLVFGLIGYLSVDGLNNHWNDRWFYHCLAWNVIWWLWIGAAMWVFGWMALDHHRKS